ncbi:MAG TPA: tripartite tricarboxylate transporter permease [Stellaceae bacterium]|nr:tripartite tricarboxylate transporter permease [Stellaceae bacterium]
MFDAALHALVALGDPVRFAILFGGVVVGLALGVIPGLGGVVGLTLLIPFTYKLDTYSSFALLLGMAAVTTVSDLIPAVLFGVPGTVGAAATVIDGHELAKKGQAGRALGAGYTSALVGGVLGAILLAAVIPVIRPFVLFIGSPELLAFSIFGLSMVAVLSGRAPLKGFAVAGLGIMLAMIGSGAPDGTERWTFDTIYLWDRLPLVPFTLGLFAMPELAEMAISRSSIARDASNIDFSLTAQWRGARDALRHWWLVLRCGWLGTILGAVPGLGASSIDWIAYGHAVRAEKKDPHFGEGDIRGVIAPEASNNAKEGGHLITTIAFGVPSGASMAVLLSAFLMHGLVPGPDMLTKHLDVTFLIIWSLTIAHVLGGLICLGASGIFARLAAVPAGKLVPIVLALMFLSAFQGSQSWGDLYVMVIFGTVGWFMKLLKWPRPPLMLGFVLGGIFERNLFISTEIYSWGWLYRPVVIGILALTLWIVLKPLRDNFRDLMRTFRSKRGPRIAVNGAVMFNIFLIAVVVWALWASWGWPWEDKLVPHTAAYAVLLFAGVNLVTELFYAGAEQAEGHEGGRGHGMDTVIQGQLPFARSLRHFAWMVCFLVVAYGIGLLPGLFFLILLHSRFEFGERWRTAVISAVAMTAISWLIFDHIFALVWPQSILGEMLPALHANFDFI